MIPRTDSYKFFPGTIKQLQCWTKYSVLSKEIKQIEQNKEILETFTFM